MTITPDHPRWDKFCNRLDDRLYVQDVPDGRRSNCQHDHTYAIEILEAMGLEPYDVIETLVYFEQHGGYCDCEILFNVDPYDPDDAPQELQP